MKENANISKLLSFISILLSRRNHADAYVKASISVRKVNKCLCKMSLSELRDIESIGKVISSEIHEYCRSGSIRYLERLLRLSSPVLVLQLAESLGRQKSIDIVEHLKIESYGDLLREYESGRIKKYLKEYMDDYKAIESLLEFLPSWVRNKHQSEVILKDARPNTGELLKLDYEFRKENEYNPKKNNIMEKLYHTGLLKIFYSSSDKAKRLYAEGDWVNIHFIEKNEYLKWIILTSKYGSLEGRRVVLGEEKESREYYKTNEVRDDKVK